MSARRLIPIILIVVGLVSIIGIAVFFVTRNNDAPTTEIDPNATPIPGVDGVVSVEDGSQPIPDVPIEPVSTIGVLHEVVVSLQTVPRGWRMTEAELTIDKRLVVPKNAITSIEDAIGLYARADIFQGETLTTDALVKDITFDGVTEFGPSSIIPPGWVAMALPMNRMSSVAYGATEGDSVDVLLTFRFWEIDEEFQTILSNAIVEEGLSIIAPFGRYEESENGTLDHIFQSEQILQRQVSLVLQNAKVISVGIWTPPVPAASPTPTRDPDAPTATPGASGVPVTPTPPPPDVILLALPPQQQLYLKYALENGADIDMAVRSANDGQIYSIENVDLTYILEQFNFEIPPNYNFTIPTVEPTVTPLP